MRVIARLCWTSTATLALTLAMIFITGPAAKAAGSGDDNTALLNAASEALDGILADGAEGDAARAAFADARGVLIFPGDTGAFGVGDGRGLLFARDAASGIWTGPAIYNVVTGSFAEPPAGPGGRVVFVIRSDVERLIASKTRLGGSGVSVGVLSGGTPPDTDLVAIGGADVAPGAGAAYADSVLAPDRAATDALYGRPFTIREAVASTADAGERVASLRRVLDGASHID